MSILSPTFAKFSIVISFACLFTLINSEPNNQDNRVSLKISDKTHLIGTQERTSIENGLQYFAFRGIPYTVPPIGENRWKESKLLDLTKPEYDATKYGNICIQWTPNGPAGSEDCLTLNIFTPRIRQFGVESRKELLPVMVYIHGGGYTVGSSSVIGPNFFMKHDVVLVTLNYRLGVFGYLSSGNKNLPGNYGALDQVTVLDWVQKYIQNFGGDPKSVTIFGHSAGGAATNILTFSPRAKGKYHKAIVQSGSALNAWALDRHPEKYFTDFATRMNCQQKISSPEVVKCLMEKTTEELYSAQAASIDFWLLPVTSKHVVDSDTRGSNAFLPHTPEYILENGLYHSTPVITGITADEGMMIYVFLHLEVGNKFKDTDYFKNVIIPKIIKSVIPFGHSEDIPRISAAVLERYFGKNELDSETSKIERVIEIYSDSMFIHAQRYLLEMYAKHGINQAYSYVFTHRTPKSPTMIWNQIKELRKLGYDHPLFDFGASHVDDMYYLFQPCELFPSEPNHVMSSEDIKFADIFTGMLVAFAKNGSPTEHILTAKGFHDWKPIEEKSIKYYNLTSAKAPMGSQYREEESIFWEQIYRSLEENHLKDEL